MKLSEKKQEALYLAIHEPVMQIRIQLLQGKLGYIGQTQTNTIEKLLFKLEIEIWREQFKVLNLEGTP